MDHPEALVFEAVHNEPTMPTRIAIFEPEADGHHFVYVRHIVHEMLNRDWHIDLATTARAQRHPSFEHFHQLFGNSVRLFEMTDTLTADTASDFRRLKDQFSRRSDYATSFQQISKQGAPDVCFMLNLDRADLPISVLGSPFGKTPFSGFLMGRQFHCPHVGVQVDSLRRRDKMASPVFERMLRLPTLRRLISVDETLVSYAQKLRPRGWEKVVHVPDAAYIRTDIPPVSRHELGLPSDKKILLAYGSLSLRKGIAELLAAVVETTFPVGVVVLLAGKQDAEVSALLASPLNLKLLESGRLIVREGFADETLEAQIFQSSDLVWVGYKDWFGMSGVLMQAAAMGKPVISMHNGLIGFLTETHGLGVTAEMNWPKQIAAGVNQLVNDPALATSLGANGRAYAKGRTVEAFGRATCDVIQETMS